MLAVWTTPNNQGSDRCSICMLTAGGVERRVPFSALGRQTENNQFFHALPTSDGRAPSSLSCVSKTSVESHRPCDLSLRRLLYCVSPTTKGPKKHLMEQRERRDPHPQTVCAWYRPSMGNLLLSGDLRAFVSTAKNRICTSLASASKKGQLPSLEKKKLMLHRGPVPGKKMRAHLMD